MTENQDRGDRRAQLVVAGAIALGVVIRLLAVRAQGFPTDVGTFEAWAERLAEIGPGRFYEPGYFSDYPPAFLYVLWLLGALFDGELLRLAVKAISIPADIGIAVLAARVLWRTAGRTSAIAAAAIWSLQPGAIFAGPYWGQVDAVGTLPLFGSIVAAGSRRWWLAGALGTLAALVKPQFGIGLLVIVAAAAFEFVREARWRPLGATLGAAAGTAYVLSVPFWGLDPTRIVAELVQLVRSASETYPYTSLYAFNLWSVFFDFWKSDTDLVFWGGVLLVIGLIASAIPLWWRRDTATLLACAVLAGLAFYFLPTRAHERYLFPVFALALTLAVARTRVLVPYVVLALTFALSLYYAFTRYEQYVDLRVPQIIEATIFSRPGQIGIALVMMGVAAYLVWRLVRGDARLESDYVWGGRGVPTPGERRWVLPAGLSPGRLPTRRDVAVATLVALAVLATRGYRLDWPREMYFDEVYHARTAFELLAEREPYEWTHPHLAKEIMALGILAFGDDREVGHETSQPQGQPSAFVVGNDGTRVSIADGSEVVVQPRGGAAASRALGVDAKALAIQGDRIIAMTSDALVVIPLADVPSNTQLQKIQLPFAGARSLSLAGDRVVVGGPSSLAIYATVDATPTVIPVPTVAVTTKTDGSELYVLDPQGTVHVISSDTAQETRALTGGRPGTAIAYAQGPNRIFVARADAPILDVFELETGSHDAVSLANARTGTFSTAATALAVVPRTDFLYALDEGRVVVVETHGSSPYASIPVTGSFLGVDGEGDKLVVAGATGWYFVVAAHRPRRWATLDVLIAGVLFGLALAAKWAGAYTLVGLLVASIAVTARAYERGRPGTGGPLDLFARRGLNAVMLFIAFAAIPAGIYLASYVRWFGGPTIPYGWSLVELTQQMYWYHSGLTAPHPAGSPWWSWPLVLKPVYWYFGASTGGDNAYIYDAGNVVLFWAGLVAFGWCVVAAVRARSVALAFVVLAGLVQYVAWIPIGRVLFFYHFFTVLPFYLLALAAGLAYLWETGRARLVVGYLGLAAAAFAYFYPFISAQPFPGAQAGMFFILPTWAYECTFYPTFVCSPTIGSSFSATALFGRLALAFAVALTVAALISWSSSPGFTRLLATVRSGTRR